MKRKGADEKIFIYRDEIEFILKKIREIEDRTSVVAVTQNRMASDLTPMYVEWLSGKSNVVDRVEDWVYV